MSEHGTLMIVDDTPENLRLLEQMLGAEGYRILAFPGGRLALAAARRQPPDLVLLDINMPEMDGFEVCRRLRAEPATQGVPILFISAAADLDHKIRAFEEGGEDYITKPFQVEEVRARIATHLRLYRLQGALEAQNQSLRALEAHRDLLAHMVIHDIRSTLQVLTAGLEVLQVKEAAVMTEHGLRVLDQLKEAGARLTDMAQDVLDVSRMEGGSMELCLEEVALGGLLQAVQDHMVFLKGRRDFRIELADPRLSAVVDAGLMRRVLQNLLGNAFKFSPTEQGIVRLRAFPRPGGVQIEVCDNGPGVPVEHRERIFEKFWQTEEGRRQPRHSAGLGLAFCRMAVEAHGGSICADSDGEWPCILRIAL